MDLREIFAAVIDTRRLAEAIGDEIENRFDYEYTASEIVDDMDFVELARELLDI